MRHDRLKKHYGRWMDIIRSLELESCILTKLTSYGPRCQVEESLFCAL